MTTAALAFPAPTNPDFPDASVSLGTSFQVTRSGDWIGCRIRIPNTLPGVALVAFAGGIQSQPFVGVPGTTMDVLFAAPTPIVPATNYTAGYFTDRYAFTNAPWPLSSTDGRIFTPNALGGLFDYGAAPVNPTNATGLFFGVSPLVQFT